VLVAPCFASSTRSPGYSLRRADGRSHRAELGRLAPGVLERGTGVGVYQFALCDVGVGPLDQQARMLATEQGSRNSPGPEVDSLTRIF
jgi:hypothetical protein